MKTALFVLDSFHIGGVSSFVQQYTGVLVESGYTVLVIGGRSNLTEYKEYFPGCKIYVSGEGPSFGIADKLKKTATYFSTLSKISAEHKVDLIHFTTTWSALIVLLHPAFRATPKIATFFGAHHLESDSLILESQVKNSLKTKITQWLRKALQKSVLSSTQVVVTFSRYAREILKKEFDLKQDIWVIPGYVNIDPEVRATSASHKTLQLLNIGRAEPRKGVQLLLPVVSILNQKGIDTRLKISSPVGFYYAGGLLERYEQENLFDQVHLIHSSNSIQKKILLQEADLFLMPSLDLETFGMTVIEALAQGVPVVVTPAGALPEVLRGLEKKLIAKAATPEAIAEVVVWYSSLTHKEKMTLRRRCIQHVRMHYTSKQVGPIVLRLYREILDQ